MIVTSHVVLTRAPEDLSFGGAALLALAGVLGTFVLLVLLSFGIRLISFLIQTAEQRAAVSVPQIPEPNPQDYLEPPKKNDLPVTESQGALKLIETEEATAAVLMAIVSDRAGIPLNRLLFQRIQKIS